MLLYYYISILLYRYITNINTASISFHYREYKIRNKYCSNLLSSTKNGDKYYLDFLLAMNVKLGINAVISFFSIDNKNLDEYCYWILHYR